MDKTCIVQTVFVFQAGSVRHSVKIALTVHKISNANISRFMAPQDRGHLHQCAQLAPAARPNARSIATVKRQRFAGCFLTSAAAASMGVAGLPEILPGQVRLVALAPIVSMVSVR